MFPFFGQGAAQSVEDAAVLARCLASASAEPEEALRRPRTTPDGPDQHARDAVFAAGIRCGTTGGSTATTLSQL
jgi:salicylate hydroxylase